MPRPTLPALNRITNTIETFRRIAIDAMPDMFPDMDVTLDIPRIGFTRRVGVGDFCDWETVMHSVPWDHTNHSLRHFRDVAEVVDGYVFIRVVYTTWENALEGTDQGEPPYEIEEAFSLAVWPVFAIRHKNAAWIDLNTQATSIMRDLFAAVGM